jgi:imidazolonepropionase-like amidohydrolase
MAGYAGRARCGSRDVPGAGLIITADAGWTGGATLTGPLAAGIRHDRLAWIGPRDAALASAPRRHVDGVLLPGLVDYHVHTDLVDPQPLLFHGLTTVRDLGADTARVFALVRRSHDPSYTGPEVLAAGPFLTAPGGYPLGRGWATDGMARPVTGPGHAASVVLELAARGPATIKVALNADAGPVPDDATLGGIVTAAHLRGLTVTVHAEGPGQVARALAAGADEFAHAPFTERLGEALIGQLAARVAIVSTLDIHGWGHATAEQATAIGNLRRFHRAGGKVRYGTDLGNGPLPAAVNAREISALREAGLDGQAIMRAITAMPLGTGHRADLVAVPADPLRDPGQLTAATPVLRAGLPVGPGGP